MQSGSDEGLAIDARPIIWDAAACMRLGVAVQALALLLTLAVQMGIFAAAKFPAVRQPTFGFELFRWALILWPPVLLFSVMSANFMYRYAVDALHERAMLVNIAIVILLAIMVIPVINIVGIPLACVVIWLLSRRRLQLKEDYSVGWLTPLCLVLITGLITFSDMLKNADRHFVVTLVTINILMSMMLADALMVNIVSILKRRGKLAPSPTTHFQFGLQTLFILSLVAGAWGLLLVNVL
jgi:hypothetical protein